MVKFCSDNCKTLCDFCRYYRGFKADMGLDIGKLKNKGYYVLKYGDKK